jgi:hypothetical protein
MYRLAGGIFGGVVVIILGAVYDIPWWVFILIWLVFVGLFVFPGWVKSKVSSANRTDLPDMYFTNLEEYCRVPSENSTSTLLARIHGMSKSELKNEMQGMTDPVAIRMVEEVIEFAYSRPATTGLDQMRNELRNLCLAKKILVQDRNR